MSTEVSSHTERQLLVMMLGVPGAGKSYFARNLAEQLDMTRVTADEVRTRLYGSIEAAHTPERKLDVFRIVNQEMEQSLRSGESVVRDNQNNHRRDRDMCRKLAQEVGAHAIIVWVQTPQALAIQRCGERSAAVDQIQWDETEATRHYNNSLQAIERPTPDEACIQIDGTADFEEQFKVFSSNLV